eukprot:Rmarinus@m.142
MLLPSTLHADRAALIEHLLKNLLPAKLVFFDDLTLDDILDNPEKKNALLEGVDVEKLLQEIDQDGAIDLSYINLDPETMVEDDLFPIPLSEDEVAVAAYEQFLMAVIADESSDSSTMGRLGEQLGCVRVGLEISGKQHARLSSAIRALIADSSRPNASPRQRKLKDYTFIVENAGASKRTEISVWSCLHAAAMRPRGIFSPDDFMAWHRRQLAIFGRIVAEAAQRIPSGTFLMLPRAGGDSTSLDDVGSVERVPVSVAARAVSVQLRRLQEDLEAEAAVVGGGRLFRSSSVSSNGSAADESSLDIGLGDPTGYAAALERVTTIAHCIFQNLEATEMCRESASDLDASTALGESKTACNLGNGVGNDGFVLARVAPKLATELLSRLYRGCLVVDDLTEDVSESLDSAAIRNMLRTVVGRRLGLSAGVSEVCYATCLLHVWRAKNSSRLPPNLGSYLCGALCNLATLALSDPMLAHDTKAKAMVEQATCEAFESARAYLLQYHSHYAIEPASIVQVLELFGYAHNARHALSTGDAHQVDDWQADVYISLLEEATDRLYDKLHRDHCGETDGPIPLTYLKEFAESLQAETDCEREYFSPLLGLFCLLGASAGRFVRDGNVENTVASTPLGTDATVAAEGGSGALLRPDDETARRGTVLAFRVFSRRIVSRISPEMARAFQPARDAADRVLSGMSVGQPVKEDVLDRDTASALKAAADLEVSLSPSVSTTRCNSSQDTPDDSAANGESASHSTAINAAGPGPSVLGIRAIIQPLLLAWVERRRDEFTEMVPRAVASETWKPASDEVYHSASALDLNSLISSTVTCFFDIGLPPPPEALLSVMEAITLALTLYINSAISTAGQYPSLIRKPLPHEGTTYVVEKGALHKTGQRLKHLAKRQTKAEAAEARRAKRRPVVNMIDTKALCTRANNLRYFREQLTKLEEAVRTRLSQAGLDAPTPEEVETIASGAGTSSNPTGCDMMSPFLTIRRMRDVLDAGLNDLIQLVGAKVVFGDLYIPFVEGIYCPSVEENRMHDVLETYFDSVLNELTEWLHEDVVEGVITGLYRAFLQAMTHVLLDHAIPRVFETSLQPVFLEDLIFLRDFFHAGGEGLSMDVVTAESTSLEVLIAALFDRSSEDLVEDYFSIREGRIGETHPFTIENIARVLLHRRDKCALKFFKHGMRRKDRKKSKHII